MKSILDVVAQLREQDPPLRYLDNAEAVAYGKFVEFELVHWNGNPRFVPSEALNLPGRPGDRSFLYRGQSIRHPTCVPSLLREMPDDEWQMKARLTLERFRVAELELLLRDHPFSHVATDNGFSTDFHGLAQHYGIATSLLDLTSNVEIAAFFAVARWDGDASAWIPMDRGTGVLYQFDWSAFGTGYTKFFEPVGFGPGLRPARQHAWTFRMRPGADFQSIPHVTAIEFEHLSRASAEIFSRFDNGAWLYPPDCLASLVTKLRDLPFVTMRSIRYAARQDGQPAEQIETVAERSAHFLSATLGIEILDGYELQLEHDDVEIAKQQASTLEQAIQRMRRAWRLVRTRKSLSGSDDA